MTILFDDPAWIFNDADADANGLTNITTGGLQENVAILGGKTNTNTKPKYMIINKKTSGMGRNRMQASRKSVSSVVRAKKKLEYMAIYIGIG